MVVRRGSRLDVMERKRRTSVAVLCVSELVLIPMGLYLTIFFLSLEVFGVGKMGT